MSKPNVELFALMSVDGKLTIGGWPTDFDRDIPKMLNASKGLHQYYELERQTADVSIISGEICSKLRSELRDYNGPELPVTCVVIDRSFKAPASSIEGLMRKFGQVLWFYDSRYSCFVTVQDCTERYKDDNVIIKPYVALEDILTYLYSKGHTNVCLQTGGTINAAFIRNKLVDTVHIVMAPIICGGKDTVTLVDGTTCGHGDVLSRFVSELSLRECRPLEDGYIELIYDVIK